MLGLHRGGTVHLHPRSSFKATVVTRPPWLRCLQPRSKGVLLPRLAGLPAVHRRSPRCSPAAPASPGGGREPGGWDEWDAEGDLVAEATSSTIDAAAWGPLHAELRARRQQQQRQEQQQHQEEEFVGRGGEMQQHQASTSGRPLDVPATAGNSVAGLAAAAAPHLHRRPLARHSIVSHPIRPPSPPPTGVEVRFFTIGAIAAVALHYLVNFAGTLPVVRDKVQRFVWWHEPKQPSLPSPPTEEPSETRTRGSARASGGGGWGALAMQYSEDEESVEWVNMCWRKAWCVYQRGIERWLADLLQPLFDSLVEQKMVPSFVQRLRIMEFTLDHEAPYFTNMRRRTSRKDSDLNGVVDVRYTGGARMLLLIEVGTGRWRIKIPVMVSDLDLESKLWLKIRLAPMCPWIGTLGLGFVGAPSIKVQLNPYNRIRLMKIPILQAFLTKLLTKDLPALITLPKRLEINIPPAVTAVAEAAVGRDAVMRAVASAVLQADALEHALLAALPLGPQGAAGGVSLPDLFQGELQVTLHEARDLPVWGFPWQSNPYCRITLGSQAVQSRRDDDTSHAGRHRAPVWNQDFQFLVEDPAAQALDIWIGDSPMTGRTEVGRTSFPLRQLASDGTADVWLPVESSMPGEHMQGAVRLVMSYKHFQEDEVDSGYRAAAAFGGLGQQSSAEITDVKSAADASSRAAVAASAAAAAVAVTKAAAARAAARIARGAALAGQQAQQVTRQGQEGINKKDDDSSNGSGGGGSGGSGAASQLLPAPAAGSVVANGCMQLQPEAGEAAAVNGSMPADKSPAAAAAAAASAAAAMSPVALAAAAHPTFSVVTPAPSSNRHGIDGSGTASSSSSRSSRRNGARARTVEQLMAMAQTMQKLTAEVDGIVHSGGRSSNGSSGSASGTGAASFSIDAEVKAAAVEAVAAAEAAAISAVAAGDLAGANQVLEDAAAALKSTVAQLAAAESDAAEGMAAVTAATGAIAVAVMEAPDPGRQAASTALHRAEEALAAAHVAAAQAVQAAAVAQAASAAVDAQPSSDYDSDGEATAAAAVGLDAAPSAEAAEQRGRGLPSYDSEGSLLPQERPAWWLAATQFVPGVPRKGDSDAAAGAVAEADGGAGVVPRDGAVLSPAPQQAQQQALQSGEAGPVADVVIPADLPLEEITAEVLKSWKLRDTHVETLVQKAMEARRKQKERPWLQLLGVMTCVTAILLAAVLWRLEHMS